MRTLLLVQNEPESYTVFRKKTPTHVFFYISMDNVKIFIKFSANV